MDTEKLLKAIVTNKELVRKHPGWGYYIRTDFEQIHMIGLIQNGKNLELTFFFGDSQEQSRAFYRNPINLKKIDNSDWTVITHFHLSSAFGRNIIWFDSNLNPKEYLKFWKENVELLHKHYIHKIPEFLKFLFRNKVIVIDENKERELESKIYSKQYTEINIGAGFGIIYELSTSQLTLNSEEFNKLLIEKINQGLSVIGKNGNNFLISPNSRSESLMGDPDGL